MDAKASIPLVRNLSFLPEVMQVAHQQEAAAVIFREIHRLHTSVTHLADRWRVSSFSGRVLLDGREWSGQPTELDGTWCVLDYGDASVGIAPLTCRRVGQDDAVRLPLRISAVEGDLLLELALYDGPAREVVEPLLFTGWCIVLLDRAEDADQWTVAEDFAYQGEVPRTYNELIRTVTLAGPGQTLTLVRDPLEDRVQREPQVWENAK